MSCGPRADIRVESYTVEDGFLHYTEAVLSGNKRNERERPVKAGTLDLSRYSTFSYDATAEDWIIVQFERNSLSLAFRMVSPYESTVLTALRRGIKDARV